MKGHPTPWICIGLALHVTINAHMSDNFSIARPTSPCLVTNFPADLPDSSQHFSPFSIASSSLRCASNRVNTMYLAHATNKNSRKIFCRNFDKFYLCYGVIYQTKIVWTFLCQLFFHGFARHFLRINFVKVKVKFILHQTFLQYSSTNNRIQTDSMHKCVCSGVFACTVDTSRVTAVNKWTLGSSQCEV